MIRELFKKFDVVGARFTKYIDDAELDQIIADCDDIGELMPIVVSPWEVRI